jgi:hypothetical protein
MTGSAFLALIGGVRAAIFAGLMLVFAGLFLWKGHEAKTVAADFRGYQDKMISLTAAAKKKAQQARDTFMRASLDNERAYQKGQQDAQDKQDSVVAAARSGELRFRQLWQGCVSTSALSGEVARAAGGEDGQADLRAEAGGRIIRAGYDADDWIIWLQSELIATRNLAETCGAH